MSDPSPQETVERSSTRHRWGERFTRLENTPSGCPQSERTCQRPGCGLVKITVHPPQGLPWREWRPKDGPQMALSSTPPCLVDEAPP